MNKEKNKIGEKFQEVFRDFREEPSPKIWEQLEAKLPLIPATRPGFIKPWHWMAGGLALLAVLSVVYFASRNTSQLPKPVNTGSSKKAEQPASTQPGISGEAAVNEAETKDIPAGQRAVVIQTPASHKQASTKTLQKEVQLSPEARESTEKEAVIAAEKKTSTTKTLVTPQASATNKPVAIQGSRVNTKNQIIPEGNSPIEFSGDQIICEGDTATLFAAGGESYLWSNGATSSTITVQPVLTSIYTVTAINAYGKQVVGVMTVKVTDCSPVYIPNAFTPNGDGDNEEFIVKGEQITDFRMVIAVRSGQIVFESEDIHKGWDGKIKGKLAETGVYVYQVSYVDNMGRPHKKTGQLTLFR